MVVPVSTQVSLGSYVKTYGEVEPFEKPFRWKEYEYVWGNGELPTYGPPVGQREVFVREAVEISNRLDCHLIKIGTQKEVGYWSREDSFAFTVEPDKDIDVLMWWGGRGNLLGQFPFFIDHRDLKKDKGVFVLNRLRYGLFEV